VDLRIENNEIYPWNAHGIFGWADSWVRSNGFPSLRGCGAGSSFTTLGDGIVVVATDGALVEHNVVGYAISGSMDTMWRLGWSADNFCDSVQRAYGTKDSGLRRFDSD